MGFWHAHPDGVMRRFGDGVTGPTWNGTTPPPSSITHGIELTAANTGIAASGLVSGDLTTYSGTLSLSNVTLTRRIINCGSNPLILGSGANLVECIIQGTAARQVIIIGTNQSMYRCNLQVATSTGGEIFGIYAGSYNGGWGGTYTKGLHIESLYHTGGSIGMWMDGDNATDDAYVKEWLHLQSGNAGGAHRDGFTRRDGNGPLLIERSRIYLNTPATTGAVFLQDTWNSPRSAANVGRITLRDNYLEGNGFCLTLEQGNNLTITGNIIRPTEYGAVTRGSLTSLTQSNNNLWVNSPPTYRGAAVTI